MIRTVDAQTLGPLLVFGAFAASDAALRLLEAYPGFAFTWYLNFELFYTFEAARLRHSPLGPLFGSYGLLASGAGIAAVILARAAKARFMIAFLANVSFAVVIALLYCRVCDPTGRSGLAWSSLREDRLAEIALGLVLLGSAFAAFVASHLSFVAAVLRERSERDRLGFGLGAGRAPAIASTC